MRLLGSLDVSDPWLIKPPWSSYRQTPESDKWKDFTVGPGHLILKLLRGFLDNPVFIPSIFLLSHQGLWEACSNEFDVVLALE